MKIVHGKFSLRTRVPSGGIGAGTESFWRSVPTPTPHLPLNPRHVGHGVRRKSAAALKESTFPSSWALVGRKGTFWMYVRSSTPTSDPGTLNLRGKVPPAPQKRKGNLPPQRYPLSKHHAWLNATLCSLHSRRGAESERGCRVGGMRPCGPRPLASLPAVQWPCHFSNLLLSLDNYLRRSPLKPPVPVPLGGRKQPEDGGPGCRDRGEV